MCSVENRFGGVLETDRSKGFQEHVRKRYTIEGKTGGGNLEKSKLMSKCQHDLVKKYSSLTGPAGDMRCEFNPWVRRIPWRRQPTPVFLSGESNEQRGLVGYSPQGCKESDRTEHTAHTHNYDM